MARLENGSDATVCRPGAIFNPSRIEELVSLGIHRREVDQHICSRRRRSDLALNFRLACFMS